MWRLAFPVLILSALFVLGPFVSRTTTPAAATGYPLSSPDETLDARTLSNRTKNRPLRLASYEELNALQHTSVAELIGQLVHGSERDRRLAASILGISGHPDAIRPLIDAFNSEEDPRALASLALALAETQSSAAIEALIQAIREREGLAAYEACRALKLTFGLNLGLDADAWERWFQATQSTRD